MEALKARKTRLGEKYDALVHLLDCCAVNDTVGVCLLLPTYNGTDSLTQKNDDSPYLQLNDTPMSVALRFKANKVVPIIKRFQESGVVEATEEALNDMRSRRVTIASPLSRESSTRSRGRMRAGSFSLFSRHAKKAVQRIVQGSEAAAEAAAEANILLTVGLGGRQLAVAVFGSTKARHCVFAIGEQYHLDLDAYGLKCAGRWLEDYQSLASQHVNESSALTLHIKHRALLKQREQKQRVLFDLKGVQHRSCVVTYDQYVEISTLLDHIRNRYLVDLDVGMLGFYVYLDDKRVYLKPGRTLASYALYDLDTDVYCCDAATQREQESPSKRSSSLGVLQVKRADLWLELLGVGELEPDSLEIYQSEGWYDDPHIAKVRARILLDLDRTLPYHPLFREKWSKGQRRLEKVLVCYAKHDRQVGYCQGMGFIAAVLLSLMSTDEAFAALLVLMKGRYGLAQSFGHQMPRLHKLFQRFSAILDSRYPLISKALTENYIFPATFLTEAFHTLFVCSAPLPVAVRLWDYYLLLGTPFLLQVAIAIVIMNQKAILENPEDAAQLLKGALKDADVDDVIKIALSVKKDQFFVSI